MKKISVLSWNIQGIDMDLQPRKFNLTGHTSFRKIEPALVTSRADIMALQEMCGAKKHLKGNPAFKEYKTYIPKQNSLSHRHTRHCNYNVLLSKFPIVSVKELMLGRGKKVFATEKVTRAEIRIGKKILRIYIAHFPVKRASMAIRLSYLEYLLSDATHHKGPVIVCGDLNTVIPETGWRRKIVKLVHLQPRNMAEVNGKWIHSAEQKVFSQVIKKYGFMEALNLRTPTWAPLKSTTLKFFHLKLDWFIVKGLKVNEVKLGNYISDHRPIYANLEVKS